MTIVRRGGQEQAVSSIAAFARTLKVHRRSLQKLLDNELVASETETARTFTISVSPDVSAELDLEDATAEQVLEADDDAAAEAASVAGAEGATREALRAELAMVDAMLAIAEPAASRSDARVRWLVKWIEQHLLAGRSWNDRRLI